MGTISTTDIIYASITHHGRQIAAYSFSGLTSLHDIINYIRRRTTLKGLLKVNLRNRSQGWSHSIALNLLPLSQPVQLSLF